MRVLFDQGAPAPLRHLLVGHDVSTAYELGWATLKNGELLTAAEQQGFQVLLTTDRNLRYQHNLAARGIAIVVLTTTSWPRIQPRRRRSLPRWRGRKLARMRRYRSHEHHVPNSPAADV